MLTELTQLRKKLLEIKSSYWAVGILMGLVLFWIPGYMSHDSITQYKTVLKGWYTNAHPPLMAWFWSQLSFFSLGQTPMLITQLTIYIYSVYLISKTTIDAKANIKSFFLASGLLIFFPPIFFLLGTIWKDILMQALAMLGIAVIVTSVNKNHISHQKIASISFLFALACCLRHNAFILVVPLIIYTVFIFYNIESYRSKLLKKASFFALIYILGIFTTSSIINHVLTDEKIPLSQVVKTFDVAGASVFANKNLFAPKVKSLQGTEITLERIKKHYSPRYHAELKKEICSELKCDPPLVKTNNTNPEFLKIIHENWLNVIFNHPIAWLKHKLAVYGAVIGFERLFAPIYFQQIQVNDLGFEFKESKFHSAVMKFARKHLIASPFYKVWCYLLFNIIFLIFLIKKKPRKFGMSISFLSSGILYHLTYLAAAPSSDFRYSLWTITMTLLAFYIFIKENKLSPS